MNSKPNSRRVITLNSTSGGYPQDTLSSLPSLTLSALHSDFKSQLKSVVHGVDWLSPGVKIEDLSLRAKGPQEDRFYLANPKVQKNFRRGNSMIVDSQVIIRRGLPKFYDLKMEHVNSSRN